LIEYLLKAIDDFLSANLARYLESLAEVLVVAFFGLFPFVVAVIRHNAIADASDAFEFITTFESSFSGGQLYLYAFSLFGTLMWLAFFNWTIPFYKSRLVIAAIVIVIGFLIVAMGGVDPTFSSIRNKSLVELSYYCYAICIALYLLLLLISKSKPPTVDDTVDTEANSLISKARSEIGGHA
jgi:hypothetical protein